MIYKLLTEKDFTAAKEEILSIKDFNKNYSLLSGLIFCTEEENPYKAETLIEKNLLNYKNSPYWYLLQLKLADEKIVNEKFDEAKVILDSLSDWAPTGGLESRINLRKIFLRNKKDAKLFLSAKEIDRFTFLKDAFEQNPSPVLLLPLIQLVDKEKVSYTSFRNMITNNQIQASPIDWFPILQLIRFAIKNSDFTSAEKFIKILEDIIPDYASESLQNEPE